MKITQLPWLSLFTVVVSALLGGCGDSQSSTPAWVNPLVDARKAIGAGDTAKAMEALTASIEQEPNVWALMERSKLYLAEEKIDEAKADCAQAKELEPENIDIAWLLGEIDKPADKRFKGRNQFPPSYRK